MPTGRLNTFFKEMVAATPPPVRGGKQPRILFATQATARPPTFVLFTTGFLDAGYRRFLERKLRETFGFEGSPIRINVRVREKRGSRLPDSSRSVCRSLSVGSAPKSLKILHSTRVALVPVLAHDPDRARRRRGRCHQRRRGSGTLITFPTLVALGYPPVTSTMSNAVGLVAGSASGTWGYRRELSGQWDRLRWQMPASFVGAGLGAWLLLHLPEKVFQQVVPVLLIAALVLVVIGPRIQEWARRRAEEAGQSPSTWSLAGWRLWSPARSRSASTAGTSPRRRDPADRRDGRAATENMQRMNAAKNLLSLVVNIVAAVAYTVVAFDRISWPAAGLIAIGCPDRRVPRRALRTSAVSRTRCVRRSWWSVSIGLYRLLTLVVRRFGGTAGRLGRLSTCCRRMMAATGCGAVW